jgi:hypothetical protein
VVVDASLTVTAWPVAVDTVKVGVDTRATVPDAPPSAGPDRAFDPPLPDPRPLGAVPDTLLVVDGLLLELGCPVVQALIATAMNIAPAALEAMSFRERIGQVLLSLGSSSRSPVTFPPRMPVGHRR